MRLRIYSSIVGLVLFIIFSVGYALPYLFSAPSDILVLLGVIYVVIALPVSYRIFRYIIQTINAYNYIKHLF